jgi:hypothetical protein
LKTASFLVLQRNADASNGLARSSETTISGLLVPDCADASDHVGVLPCILTGLNDGVVGRSVTVFVALQQRESPEFAENSR